MTDRLDRLEELLAECKNRGWRATVATTAYRRDWFGGEWYAALETPVGIGPLSCHADTPVEALERLIAATEDLLRSRESQAP